ncbi:MAG: hypothetical protein WD603_03035 [Patescibacteria group bacterium]
MAIDREHAAAAEAALSEHRSAIREAEGKIRLVADCGQSVAIDSRNALGKPRSDEEWRVVRRTVADSLGIDARDIRSAEQALLPVPGCSMSLGRDDRIQLTVEHLRSPGDDGSTYFRYALDPVF